MQASVNDSYIEEKVYCVATDGLEMVPHDTTKIYFRPLDNRWSYDDLLKLPKSIEVLYLGHDGVIYGTSIAGKDWGTSITNEHIKSVLNHFNNLKEISVCSYCSQFSGDVDIFTNAGVKVFYCCLDNL